MLLNIAPFETAPSYTSTTIPKTFTCFSAFRTRFENAGLGDLMIFLVLFMFIQTGVLKLTCSFLNWTISSAERHGHIIYMEP